MKRFWFVRPSRFRSGLFAACSLTALYSVPAVAQVYFDGPIAYTFSDGDLCQRPGQRPH